MEIFMFFALVLISIIISYIKQDKFKDNEL